MEEIILGNNTFNAIEVVDLTAEALTPEHKVEAGYSVVDHIVLQPKEFRLTLTLNEDELRWLEELYRSKQPTTFVCKFGVFDNVVVKEISLRQGDALNVFKATCVIKQILIAKAKTTTLPMELNLTPAEEEMPGGDVAVEPPEQEVPQAPAEPESEEKSWLDSIFEFMGMLFAGEFAEE